MVTPLSTFRILPLSQASSPISSFSASILFTFVSLLVSKLSWCSHWGFDMIFLHTWRISKASTVSSRILHRGVKLTKVSVSFNTTDLWHGVLRTQGQPERRGRPKTINANMICTKNRYFSVRWYTDKLNCKDPGSLLDVWITYLKHSICICIFVFFVFVFLVQNKLRRIWQTENWYEKVSQVVCRTCRSPI